MMVYFVQRPITGLLDIIAMLINNVTTSYNRHHWRDGDEPG